MRDPDLASRRSSDAIGGGTRLVENQATDRAFRIGQKRNVLVHKFVCRGTVEERIDELIESKRALADQLVEGGARCC
jgi:SNF2 family DNA or RNA helicase